ncbi:MAG: guanitoxin biosynthesis heme-dependent pre-guanitoxin N-hydroxylase GntA [Ideonella sp.]
MCPFSSPAQNTSASNHSARAAFEAFIGEAEFPCVGARSALNRGRLRFAHFHALGDPSVAGPLRDALAEFSEEFPNPGAQPVSFIATFDATVSSERAFESQLWRQLQLLHDADRLLSQWNASVSSNPADAEFSMSVAGRAFFVVGMHPAASRLARRSPAPTLVFNFHDQFVSMKESGKYGSMQKAIRGRDIALQGSINPVLARFGEASEARQYSGRAVEGDWVCPFSNRESANV